MKPSLAVVICNYNKIQYLKGCLDSLWVSKKDWPDMKVFVVDNASQDGSQQMIQADYADWVELIPLDTNTGGAGGFSRGMQAAVASQCEYTALLDNDILLDDDTLPELVSYLHHQPAVGVAGAKICTMDNPDILQELGAFIDWENYNVNTPLKGQRDSISLPTIVACDYVPACCMVTRTDIIRQVGTFDEAHFIYWDDMDWCTRVKQAGYEIHAVSKARVRHKMGAVNTPTTFSNYYFERNRLRFFARYLSEDQFLQFAKKRCSELAPQMFFASRKGQQSQAMSAQMAITDFACGIGFARPDAVFDKQAYDIKQQFSQAKPLMLIGDDDHQIEKVKIQLIAAGLPLTDSCTGEVTRIHVCSHILALDEANAEWVVDDYLNVCEAAKLPALKGLYEQFVSMFRTIQEPVFVRQMMIGYDSVAASLGA